MDYRERTPRRQERIQEVLSRRQKDLTLVLDNIHDPHNVSAILRSCDAFGVPLVHLYYTDEAFPALGRKTSASAVKWVERKPHSDSQMLLQDLRGQGLSIVRTGFSPEATPLLSWDLTGPAAVILGNEHRGVSQELADEVDDEIFIPMMGMVQSLNVSVAAAVILYEAWRQRYLWGMYDHPSFDSGWLETMFSAWCRK
jgi:tRNA (guanosine-2'-O-)-methyltransferase